MMYPKREANIAATRNSSDCSKEILSGGDHMQLFYENYEPRKLARLAN